MTTRTSPTNEISPGEWETLSVYLDGKLSPQESAALEKRLQENPDLRSSLDELIRIRGLLRNLPRLRARRNFTLTPEMAGLCSGVRSIPNAYPLLRLASVLATVFLVLLSVSQIMFLGNRATSVMQREALVMVTSEGESQITPMPSFGIGGGVGVETEVPALEAEIPQAATEASMEEAPIAALPEQPTQSELEKVVGDASLATAEANSLAVTPLGLPSTSTPAKVEAADQVVSVTEDISLPIPAPEGVALYPGASRETRIGTWSWSFLNVLQIILAILAVGTGLAAIWIRRSNRY
jgi:anti-sigma factor RsiW